MEQHTPTITYTSPSSSPTVTSWSFSHYIQHYPPFPVLPSTSTASTRPCTAAVLPSTPGAPPPYVAPPAYMAPLPVAASPSVGAVPMPAVPPVAAPPQPPVPSLPAALDQGPVSAPSLAAAPASTCAQEMLMRPWMQSTFMVQLSSSGREQLKYRDLLRQKSAEHILMRAAATTEESHPRKRYRLLETLVKPGGQMAMSLEHVVNEMITIGATGTETTATAIEDILMLLALYPEWQDAVHQELMEVFGGGQNYMRAPTSEDLARLRVLESVIKEALRLCPLIPSLPRQAVEDLPLAGGQVVVPKGALIMVAPYLTHRHPDFFPDPDRFDPGRFLDGDAGKRHPCSYFPFGLGQRNCVGLQYARLQLKVCLAAVLRRHRVLPHSSREDLECATFSITAKPLNPLKLSFVPLESPAATA